MTIRDRRRGKGERAPAIWRGQHAPPPDELQHGERETAINWRIFSALIVVSLSLVLLLFFISDAFYVRSISVAGLNYLQPDEIYRWADIADAHIFQLNEESVRQSILRSPAIADAQVMIAWPPDSVRIAITEREPALLWEQDNQEYWIDLRGRILMTPPIERTDLLRVRVIGDAPAITPETLIDADVINGALQLRELIPNTNLLRYDPYNGLGFEDARGWDAWFGSGLDMPVKILVYKSLTEDLQAKGITMQVVNVVDPDAPYYCCVE
ncbi:MAG: FtsQ-type POTRA domain-containing protein [Anaerolineae bacterium]|jgi:hypothetical protein|nr:FtsQ-type POTRA domain-containing protein [Anaerolineae bacterium]